ncbi:hypothetical protein F7725_009547 [Dissostichus mawsoni]|uniref:Uncharacterized protein n=1 Tax=Dissostichus mawsoni TaxID=36200 RepID=A0A7J5XMI9_DISMA|nr:hypothetical protein F7725_009547 [Dissostichus mawsoni]
MVMKGGGQAEVIREELLSCSPVCPPPPPQVLNSERVQALEAWLMETDTKLAQGNGQRKYGGPPAGETCSSHTPHN